MTIAQYTKGNYRGLVTKNGADPEGREVVVACSDPNHSANRSAGSIQRTPALRDHVKTWVPPTELQLGLIVIRHTRTQSKRFCTGIAKLCAYNEFRTPLTK